MTTMTRPHLAQPTTGHDGHCPWCGTDACQYIEIDCNPMEKLFLCVACAKRLGIELCMDCGEPLTLSRPIACTRDDCDLDLCLDCASRLGIEID